MASATKQIVREIPTFIRIYNDGTIERPRNFPFVPPSPEDPETGVSSKDIIISENPSISARLYLPKFNQSKEEEEHSQNQKLPILVYYRGGAFFFESAFSSHIHGFVNLLVSKAKVMAVSVEYRNAPEHLLPAAFEDCWAALQWVASHSTKYPTNSEPWLTSHGDFNRLFIGGDRGGGNIVHNIAMRAGAETLAGDVKIFGAYLNHPYFCGSKPVGSEPVIGFQESFPYVVWNFVYPSAPGGLDNSMINPMAHGAPSLATLGCSNMLVTAAGKDFLRLTDRAVMYYEAVKESGWKGEVELFVEKEEDHVYHMNNPESENGKKMVKLLVDFLHQ